MLNMLNIFNLLFFQKLVIMRKNLILLLVSLVFIVVILCYLIDLRINKVDNEITQSFESLRDIFKISGEQSLIKPDVIMKTIRFMVDEVDEYDKGLISFVRSLIHQPSNKALNLNEPNKTDFSQIGQSLYVDSLLGNKRKGFFIEAGAWDGEWYSNTLYLEIKREWTGLLIEPLPSLFKTVISKNRNVFAINACLAKNKPIVSKFKIQHFYSGRSSEMSEEQSKVIGNDFINAYIPCFSINTILAAMNINDVDYFSMDLEGGEWDTLNSIDYDRFNINSFSVEYLSNNKPKENIIEFMREKNYRLTKTDVLDLFFIKN